MNDMNPSPSVAVCPPFTVVGLTEIEAIPSGDNVSVAVAVTPSMLAVTVSVVFVVAAAVGVA